MLRTTSLLTLTAAFALSASLAGACPFSKNEQTTQVPEMPGTYAAPMSTASNDIQSAIATHDEVKKPSATADGEKQQ